LPADFIEAIVTLTIEDNGRSRSAVVRFSNGERTTKSVELPSIAEQAPPVRVDALVIRGDGSTFAASPFETTDPVVLVSDRDGPSRQVSLRLIAGESLAAHGLMAVQVELLDADDEAIDSVAFTESRRDPQRVLWPTGPGAPPKMRYRVTRYALDGTAKRGEREESAAAEVLIRAVVA